MFGNVKNAYNKLWDVIEANRELLSSEVWSWVYRDNDFQYTTLGELPPPPGVGGSTGKFKFIFSCLFSSPRMNMKLT